MINSRILLQKLFMIYFDAFWRNSAENRHAVSDIFVLGKKRRAEGPFGKGSSPFRTKLQTDVQNPTGFELDISGTNWRSELPFG